MGSGKPNMQFAGDAARRQESAGGNAPKPAYTFNQESAPGLEATPPRTAEERSRLPGIEKYLGDKGSPEYEQLMERIRGMNAMKNTGSRF